MGEAWLFYCGSESEHHIFFESLVARKAWFIISDIVSVSLGSKLESIAKYWPSNESLRVANMVSSAALLLLWNPINDLCFPREGWRLEKYAGAVEENHSNGEKLQDSMPYQ